MTDNEIIKAYEDKLNLISSMTSVYFDESDGLDLYEVMLNVLYLIIRQQATIERLKEYPKCVYEYDGDLTDYCLKSPCSNYKTVEQIKAEAVKEFAEQAKHRLCLSGDYLEEFENLVQEMVGEE